MNIKARIEKMEKDLTEPAETVIRFADADGTYKEEQEDDRKGNNVIKIIIKKVKGTDVKRWAQ